MGDKQVLYGSKIVSVFLPEESTEWEEEYCPAPLLEIHPWGTLSLLPRNVCSRMTSHDRS